MSYDEAQEWHREWSRETPDLYYHRIGLELRLPLTDGSEKIYENYDCDCDGRMNYIYRGYLEKIDSFLIELDPWEGEGYLLVSRTSGEDIFLSAHPVISPSGDFVVSAYNCQQYECWHANSISVIRVTRKTFETECHRELDWEPADPIWLDNKTIRLRKLNYDSKEESARVYPLVRIDGGGWFPLCWKDPDAREGYTESL